MSRSTLHELPVDTHKRNVAGFFSGATHYWADVYTDAESRNESFDSYAKRRRLRLVLDMLDRCVTGRHLALLDVGCGPGLFLEEAACRGHEVHGVDISKRMVKVANARLGELVSGRPPCQQGDIECLPFASGSMDVILCLGVLPYLRDDRLALAEISRVLKDGGIAIVVLPNLVKLGNLLDPYYYLVRGWQYLWYRLFRADAVTQRAIEPDRFGANSMFGIRRYTGAQIRTMFSLRGFSILETRGIDYGPVTFWKRRFLPDRVSTALSELLSKVEQLQALSWLAGLANESVLCIRADSRLPAESSL